MACPYFLTEEVTERINRIKIPVAIYLLPIARFILKPWHEIMLLNLLEISMIPVCRSVCRQREGKELCSQRETTPCFNLGSAESAQRRIPPFTEEEMDIAAAEMAHRILLRICTQWTADKESSRLFPRDFFARSQSTTVAQRKKLGLPQLITLLSRDVTPAPAWMTVIKVALTK